MINRLKHKEKSLQQNKDWKSYCENLRIQMSIFEEELSLSKIMNEYSDKIELLKSGYYIEKQKVEQKISEEVAKQAATQKEFQQNFHNKNSFSARDVEELLLSKFEKEAFVKSEFDKKHQELLNNLKSLDLIFRKERKKINTETKNQLIMDKNKYEKLYETHLTTLLKKKDILDSLCNDLVNKQSQYLKLRM